ncbi:MAG TPA: transcription antitermination factor NusB [Alphaproteobacteria bacterium]|nr:transcription antitermination factor NusB [Alphaproteobacteria bacterium]
MTENSSAQKSAARLAAVQALYQIELTSAPPEKVVRDFLAGKMPVDAEVPLNAFDRELFGFIVHATWEQGDNIDTVLSASLDEKWPLDRLEKILRALLRAGAAEILTTQADAPIVINDYINIAHAFFSGKEPGLVNAVLDRVAKQVR